MKNKIIKMMCFFVLLAIVFSSVPDCFSVTASVKADSYADLSSHIVQGHPRLYVTSFEGLKDKYLADSLTSQWYNALIDEANAICSAGVTQYDTEALNEKKGNVRVIDSQAVLDRFYCLAFAAAVENSEAYAAKLWLEIEAAISLPHWNPWHWLEVAEMMHSMAIAYDWCYKFWDSDQLRAIENAIVTFGLTPAIKEYDGTPQYNQWVYGMDGKEVGSNWTVVCNAGVLMGALAIYETNTELCNTMINNAIRSMKAGTNAYSEDGSYKETLNYWRYATGNLIMAVDGFESAVGGDFDMLPALEAPFEYDFSKAEGIQITCDFPIYANGSAGVFNYGDVSNDGKISSPAFMWLGSRFNTGHYIKYHVDNLSKKGVAGENIPLDLLWYESGGSDRLLPQDKIFENDFASMRSSWDDNSLFVTLKGGKNGRNHQHYDIGTFVLDVLGERFAHCLGAIGYDWDGSRSDFYKARTEGQNTIVINPDQSCGQNTSGIAEFEAFYSGKESSYAILDMTDVYEYATTASGTSKTDVISARRGIKMCSDKTRIIVQDEVKMSAPSTYYWFMHTAADITLYNNNKSAVLTLKGKSIYLNLLSEHNAVFEVMDAIPLESSPEPEGLVQNYGKKLAVCLEDITNATIAVEMSSVNPTVQPYFKKINALDSWHPENDIVRSEREISIYGETKAGTYATVIVKSPLGYVYGVDQSIADENGEYEFHCTLPEDYENGIYTVYLNGDICRIFGITDGADASLDDEAFVMNAKLPVDEDSVVMIAAEYRGNNMVQIAIGQYDRETSSASFDFPASPSMDNRIKIFYLDDLECITPLCSDTETIVQ